MGADSSLRDETLGEERLQQRGEPGVLHITPFHRFSSNFPAAVINSGVLSSTLACW